MSEKFKSVPIAVHYLEMHIKPYIKTTEISNASFSKLIPPITTKDYLHYYKTVGVLYNWNDRIVMDDAQLYKIINDNKTEIFTYTVNNETVGFAEFIREDTYTEILYFGLFPDYIGKGLGKHFLKEVILEAWSNSTQWIQLNTCAFDHPNALSVYENCGFKLIKTVVENRKIRI